MSLQDPSPLHRSLGQAQRNQPSQDRKEEVDLLRRLALAREEPVLVAARQLLAVRLHKCQVRLVKASLNDVPVLQGEARALEKLLTDLSGERVTTE